MNLAPHLQTMSGMVSRKPPSLSLSGERIYRFYRFPLLLHNQMPLEVWYWKW